MGISLSGHFFNMGVIRNSEFSFAVELDILEFSFILIYN